MCILLLNLAKNLQNELGETALEKPVLNHGTKIHLHIFFMFKASKYLHYLQQIPKNTGVASLFPVRWWCHHSTETGYLDLDLASVSQICKSTYPLQ